MPATGPGGPEWLSPGISRLPQWPWPSFGFRNQHRRISVAEAGNRAAAAELVSALPGAFRRPRQAALRRPTRKSKSAPACRTGETGSRCFWFFGHGETTPRRNKCRLLRELSQPRNTLRQPFARVIHLTCFPGRPRRRARGRRQRPQGSFRLQGEDGGVGPAVSDHVNPMIPAFENGKGSHHASSAAGKMCTEAFAPRGRRRKHRPGKWSAPPANIPIRTGPRVGLALQKS